MERYAAVSGAPLPSAALAQLADLGMVEISAGRLRASKAGRPLLNAILRELLA
jgi:oxygen-independent coproporphyrinogen-3 oxidase